MPRLRPRPSTAESIRQIQLTRLQKEELEKKDKEKASKTLRDRLLQLDVPHEGDDYGTNYTDLSTGVDGDWLKTPGDVADAFTQKQEKMAAKQKQLESNYMDTNNFGKIADTHDEVTADLISSAPDYSTTVDFPHASAFYDSDISPQTQTPSSTLLVRNGTTMLIVNGRAVESFSPFANSFTGPRRRGRPTPRRAPTQIRGTEIIG